MPLKPKQQQFVTEFLVDFNAAAAARRAGYSESGAKVQGFRLLTNANVQQEIQAQRARAARSHDVSKERLLQEDALIAYSDIGEILDFSGDVPKLRPMRTIPESARRAISSFKIKRRVEGLGDAAHEVEIMEFRFWSKDAAHERLMKHLGILKDGDDKPFVVNVNVLLESVNQAREQSLQLRQSAIPQLSERTNGTSQHTNGNGANK